MELIIKLILALLDTYMLTLLLTSADGPYGVFTKLRGIKGLGALKCFLCTSIWTGAVLALFLANTILEWPLYALALAGGAVLLDRLTMGRL